MEEANSPEEGVPNCGSPARSMIPDHQPAERFMISREFSVSQDQGMADVIESPDEAVLRAC
jgi:hypothetical protein